MILSLEVKVSNSLSSLARSLFIVYVFGRTTFIELDVYMQLNQLWLALLYLRASFHGINKLEKIQSFMDE